MSKLNKKKFTAGLESVFMETTDAFEHEKVGLVDEPEKRKIKASTKSKKVKRIKPRGNNKDFTSDLDTLLEMALSESDNNYNEQQTEAKGSFKNTTKGLPAITGLDALIRQTIDIKTIDRTNSKKPTKRVTFSIDKEKLQRLKQIARIENAYMKDILSGLITDYIEQFEGDKQ